MNKLTKRAATCMDERIVNESNRIYRLCFYILCGGMLLDLLVKFNLYNFSENAAVTVQLFLPETLLLFAVFYTNIFMLARKGIAFGAEWYDLSDGAKCPTKRYAAISLAVALVIAIGLWTPRLAFGNWEYGVFAAILFCAVIYIVTFVLAFLVMFVSLRVAFRMAKRSASDE